MAVGGADEPCKQVFLKKQGYFNSDKSLSKRRIYRVFLAFPPANFR
jgi:hypothetical protein